MQVTLLSISFVWNMVFEMWLFQLQHCYLLYKFVFFLQTDLHCMTVLPWTQASVLLCCADWANADDGSKGRDPMLVHNQP